MLPFVKTTHIYSKKYIHQFLSSGDIIYNERIVK